MEPARLVERCYALVSDLDPTPEALAELLHPELRVVEQPNALTRTDGLIRGHETFDCYEPLPGG
jgi:hypothetical protein